MSGQPYNSVKDMKDFRKEYLSVLKLQAQINDKNLQANKAYRRTGVPITEMTDFRTPEEKLLDVERLKIDVKSKLLEIMSQLDAQEVVGKLKDDELRFIFTNWKFITEDLKRRIGTDKANSYIFLDYVNNVILELLQQRVLKLRTAEESSSGTVALNEELLMEIVQALGSTNMISKQDTSNWLVASMKLAAITSTLETYREQIDNIVYLPAKEEAIKIYENVVDSFIDDVNPENLSKIAEDLKISILRKDGQGIRKAVNAYANVVNKIPNIESALKMINSLTMLDYSEKKISKRETEEMGGEDIAGAQMRTDDKQQRINDFQSAIGAVGKSKKSVLAHLTAFKSEINKYDFTSKSESIKNLLTDFNNLNISKSASRDNLIAIVNGELYNRISNLIMNGDVKKIVGTGFKGKMIGRGLGSFAIDYNYGVEEEPKYMQFGKLIMNKQKLNKGIVSLKRPAGSYIPGLPAQRVSNRLASLLKTITGGGIPSFDELNSLDADEKAYLNKVAKVSNIDAKISIPTPNKDADEKLINEFEILRGEIMAGNDNKDLIKKFKVKLVDMSNKQLLPKQQARELLMDLASMGL
jgi:hypothetical protein